MSFSLILNSTNNINTTTNTQFKYNFLSGNFHAKDMEMCVSSIAIPYAFFNVSTFYANQTFSILFPVSVGAGSSFTLNITLPAGFYTVADINNYIQNQMLINGLYLINKTTLQNVFFFNLSVNTAYYTTQIVATQVPALSGAGIYSTLYNLPPSGQYSGTGLPANATQVPRLVLPTSGGINTLIGWPAGTFPTLAVQASTYTQTGSGAQVAAGISPTRAPIGSTINSLVVRCSILKNDVTIPSDVLDGFPINTTFGSNITYSPPFEKWIKINDGTYSSFTLSFVDQDLNTVFSVDPNVAVTLLIRKIR